MSNPFEWIQQALGGFWQGLTNAVQNAVGNVGGFVNSITSGITNTFTNIGNAIWGGLQTIGNAIQSAIKWITELPQAIFGGLMWIGNTILQAIQGFISWLAGGMQWVWSRVTEFLGNVWNTITGGVTQFWNMLTDWFWGAIGKVLDLVTSPFKKIWEWAQSLWKFIDQALIEVVIHNLPQTFASFVVGEILANIRDIIVSRGEINTLISMVLLPIGATIMGSIYQSILTGGIGAAKIPYEYATKIRGTSTYTKPALSQSYSLAVSLYLLKESSEPVQSLGKARITYLPTVKLEADYYVDVAASLSITKGQQVSATYYVKPNPISMTVQTTQLYQVSKTFTVSAAQLTMSVTAAQIVNITPTYTVSAQDPTLQVSTVPPVTVSGSYDYTYVETLQYVDIGHEVLPSTGSITVDLS